MAKKRKTNHRNRENERDLIKPDYAMDKMEPPKKPEKEEKPKEEAFHVEETVGGSTAEKLALLKAQLTEAEEKTKPKPQTKPQTKQKQAPRSAKERLEENPDLSFAELFDPADDDESSFADMLKDSKLDWKFFKDE